MQSPDPGERLLSRLPDDAYDWTLARSLTFTGIGVHTGAPAELLLHPSERPGLWLRWGDQLQPIAAGLVRDTRFCTTLGPVMTLEHVLAALYGLGVSAAEIEIEDPEAPILDGSAAPIVRALLSAGLTALPSRRKVYRLRAPWQWSKGDITIVATPADRLEIDYHIEFARPGTRLDQQRQFVWSPSAFAREIAPARTFSFADDVAAMHGQGLALGGSLANALLLCEDGGSVNPPRFDDEPVRHKILDLIGDLALLGGALRAHLRILRGGHTAHVTMVKSLKAQALLVDE